jgi:hypothetical protein
MLGIAIRFHSPEGDIANIQGSFAAEVNPPARLRTRLEIQLTRVMPTDLLEVGDQEGHQEVEQPRGRTGTRRDRDGVAESNGMNHDGT